MFLHKAVREGQSMGLQNLAHAGHGFHALRRVYATSSEKSLPALGQWRHVPSQPCSIWLAGFSTWTQDLRGASMGCGGKRMAVPTPSWLHHYVGGGQSCVAGVCCLWMKDVG